jgi:1-acyl-sn-glycerol-3-phosphate acyltransferase
MFIFTIFIVSTLIGIFLIQQLLMPVLTRTVMGDAPTAMLWLLNRVYLRLVHHVQVFGVKIIPKTIHPGKLIVVCKHQSPIDPLLVQSQCRFKIRWLMAKEFMVPSLDFIWKHSQVIPVARDGHDSAALRTALRCLRNNEVIGIFPEGGIHSPRNAIHPFVDGIGAMVAISKAKVLLVSVDGTPQNDEMMQAAFESSHSKVTFIDLIEFPENATKNEITDALRARLTEATGWSLVN